MVNQKTLVKIALIFSFTALLIASPNTRSKLADRIAHWSAAVMHQFADHDHYSHHQLDDPETKVSQHRHGPFGSHYHDDTPTAWHPAEVIWEPDPDHPGKITIAPVIDYDGP